MTAFKERAAPRKPPAKRPFADGDLLWSVLGYPNCCGSAVIYGFRSFATPASLELDKLPAALLERLRLRLPGTPNVNCITQGKSRGGAQCIANKVLPQIGFEKICEFKGNGGTHLTMWSYTRPNKRIKPPTSTKA